MARWRTLYRCGRGVYCAGHAGSKLSGRPHLGELWRNVTIEQLDQYTIRFTLDEPFPSFLHYTTIGMLPSHLLGNVAAVDLPYHDFSTRNPVGTGMFMVDEVTTDQVVLATNPNTGVLSHSGAA